MQCNILRILTIVILGLTIGCNKDSAPTQAVSAPDPIAEFTFSGTLVTPATVLFKNTSQHADTYQWNFGDGTVSSDSCPTKVYSSAGTFTVTLLASLSSTGKADSAVHQVTVTPGRVFLESVSIVAIPFTNSSGNPWDIGSGPDLYPNFVDYNNVLVNWRGSYISDVQSGNLPLTWAFAPQWEVTDWTKVYFVKIYDHDPLGDDDYIGAPSGFTVNDIITYFGYASNIPLKDLTGNITVSLYLRWL
jgi:hypothetical protein